MVFSKGVLVETFFGKLSNKGLGLIVKNLESIPN